MANTMAAPYSGDTNIPHSASKELVVKTPPQGFGSFKGGYNGSHDEGYEYYNQQRYDGIFDEDIPGTNGFSGDYWHTFSESLEPDTPYDETVLVIRSSKRGIRFSLQARTRTFFLIVIIVIALLAKPGIGDVVGTMVQSALGLH